VYEIKLDGYRAIAFRSGGRVHLRSRNNKDFVGWQNYGSSAAPVVFFVFDLLIPAGRNVMNDGLSTRRALRGDHNARSRRRRMSIRVTSRSGRMLPICDGRVALGGGGAWVSTQQRSFRGSWTR
jgi:ATP-dependent DNA ligase